MVNGEEYALNGKVFTTANDFVVTGGCEAVRSIGCQAAMLVATVASISTDVVLRKQGTLDGTNWFTLDTPDTIDTTISANGTYGFLFPDAGTMKEIRLYWVSTTGGAPTITVTGMATPLQR